ncbi:MAG: hypothetical protein QM820_64750 [Minicystis sp.]
MPSFSSTSAARMPSHVDAILDQHPLARGARRLVELDEVAALGDGRLGVVGEPRVDLGGDAPRHDLQDAQPEVDRQPIDGEPHDPLALRAARLLLRPAQGAVDDVAVLRHLRRRGDERGVGGRVARLELLDRLDVAGVGDGDGHRVELLEQGLGHLAPPQSCIR